MRPQYLAPRQLYAVLAGRTYPSPFRYLASWSESRRQSALQPVPPDLWQSLAASLDAQRMQRPADSTCKALASSRPDW